MYFGWKIVSGIVNGIVFRMAVPIGANVRCRLSYAIYRFAFICCFFFYYLYMIYIHLGLSSQPLKIIEVCLEGTESIQRLNCFSEVKTNLQEIQQYFITRKSLGMIVRQCFVELFLSA